MAFDLPTILTVGIGGLAIGLAIGCIGIGGVLLAPLLTYALGLPVRMAIAAALWSYLWSGSIPWSMAPWLFVAALPTAYLGAKATAILPGRLLEGSIAALLIIAGLYALRPPPGGARGARRLGTGAMAGLGAFTGFISTVVGAGGALVLVPILVALDQPILLAVGLGQAIQVPIAFVASLTNLLEGRVDLLLGTSLAVTLSLGIVVGTPLAHALPQTALKRLVSFVMVAAGIAIAARLTLAAV